MQKRRGNQYGPETLLSQLDTVYYTVGSMTSFRSVCIVPDIMNSSDYQTSTCKQKQIQLYVLVQNST